MNFDSEDFKPNKVMFDNPERRWEEAFGDSGGLL